MQGEKKGETKDRNERQKREKREKGDECLSNIQEFEYSLVHIQCLLTFTPLANYL